MDLLSLLMGLTGAWLSMLRCDFNSLSACSLGSSTASWAGQAAFKRHHRDINSNSTMLHVPLDEQQACSMGIRTV